MGRTDTSRTSAVLLVAAAPAVWALHLGVSYWLVPVACEAGTASPIHVTTGIALAATAAIILLGARTARTTRPTGGMLVGTAETELEHRTTAGLGRLAAVMGVYFALVIAMTGVVAVVMRPCS